MERLSEIDRGVTINKLLRVLDFGNSDEVEKVIEVIEVQYNQVLFRSNFEQYKRDNPRTESAAIACNTDNTRHKKADVVFIFDKINGDKKGVKHMTSLTLEQAKKMDPSTIEIESPSLDPWWEKHLLWLLGNHPQWTKELYEKGELEAVLLKVVQKATLMEYCLDLEGGLGKDEIIERVLAAIVAPTDGPAFHSEPPERLPEALELEILNWSRALDES